MRIQRLRSSVDLWIFNAEIEEKEIEERFGKITKLLFEKTAIKTNDKTYLFKGIEFYFYNRNHRDIITHPRNSKALCWYVNDFGGMDLNFESRIDHAGSKINHAGMKYILDDKAYFGGILIRQLVSADGSEVLDGPWACAELFRTFSATDHTTDLPILIERDNGMTGYVRKTRRNLLNGKQTAESKVKNILIWNYSGYSSKGWVESEEVQDLYNEFKNFMYKK